jgi:hypothetical protein
MPAWGREPGILDANISLTQAHLLGPRIGVDFDLIDDREFRRGVELHLQRRLVSGETPVSDAELSLIGITVQARLREAPEFYSRLDQMLWAQHQAERLH